MSECVLNVFYSAFIIFALGETEMLPMNAAFLDRAVLRVPKASDIKAFLARKEEEAAKEWETQKEEQEEMRYHMEKREAHLSELEGFTETKQETVTNLATNEQVGMSRALAPYTRL